jgi:DNA-binding FadR family transcriptional regulator
MAQTWHGVVGDSFFVPVQGGGVLADSVAQKIADAVAMGLIADGEQLPSETDLSVQLGVSTVTLRAALLILRQQGLVETRRGRNGGSFVRSSGATSPAKSLERLEALTPSYLRDLGDELFAIAGVTAMLAARRFDEQNLGRLHDLVSQLEQAEDRTQAARLDTRFHIEVAVSTQSERLTHRVVALHSEYVDLLWLPESNIEVAPCAADHRAIVDAIRAEDAETARALAESHAAANARQLIELRLRMFS